MPADGRLPTGGGNDGARKGADPRVLGANSARPDVRPAEIQPKPT